jgi:hypothetical protein
MEELITAWRALGGKEDAPGWRTIAVGTAGPCRFLAGRHFPGNEEALLVGFSKIRLPDDRLLPRGKGFVVERASMAGQESARVWIALSRQPYGSLDLFARVVDDVMATLRRAARGDDETLFQQFLARVRAWQEFMRRSGDGVLGFEEEIGLFGELCVLRELLEVGLKASSVVTAWQGPLDGVHDFVLGAGALEVKSTVAASGFPATISSLEQLDDALVNPILLACIRLRIDAPGLTLPAQVAHIRDLLAGASASLADFNARVLSAGFLDMAADRYSRRFIAAPARVMRVSNALPRLTRTDTPVAIMQAQYEIDLEMVGLPDIGIASGLEELGVIAWS